MSDREQIQNQIVEWLQNHRNRFNAPYGILDSLEAVGKGKVRTVTFGQARWLDATVCIWTPKRLSVRAAGPASIKLGPIYHSVDDFLKALEEML